MKRTPPPLRFLLLVVGGWMCVRTAVHAPRWWVGEVVAGPIASVPSTPASASEQRAERAAAAPETTPQPPALTPLAALGSAEPIRRSSAPPPPPIVSGFRSIASHSMSPPGAGALSGGSVPPPALLPLPLPQRFGPGRAVIPGRADRWSGSAWLLLRRDGGPAPAQGGTLGGRQAGLRIGYRLSRDGARPLGIAARLYAPVGDRRAAEAALGLDWRPLARVPVSLVAERREALGPRGRSAFAIGAHGGVSDVPTVHGVRLDAYGQAGIVGTRSRDLYADGAARLTIPTGSLNVGASLSGGAQPGAARLDAGPLVALRLPAARLRVSAEWRFRIAGDARPDSGPVLTVGTDF
jgi:hypothetical protein